MRELRDSNTDEPVGEPWYDTDNRRIKKLADERGDGVLHPCLILDPERFAAISSSDPLESEVSPPDLDLKPCISVKVASADLDRLARQAATEVGKKQVRAMALEVSATAEAGSVGVQGLTEDVSAGRDCVAA